RAAQQVMRHSDLKLTMKVYTDPCLLDLAGAVAELPEISLTVGANNPLPAAMQATGTDDQAPSDPPHDQKALSLPLAQTAGSPCPELTLGGNATQPERLPSGSTMPLTGKPFGTCCPFVPLIDNDMANSAEKWAVQDLNL